MLFLVSFFYLMVDLLHCSHTGGQELVNTSVASQTDWPWSTKVNRALSADLEKKENPQTYDKLNGTQPMPALQIKPLARVR